LLSRVKIIYFNAFVASLCGIISALIVSIFLVCLNFVTEFRILHSILIFLLPLAGLLIVFLYSLFEPRLSKGTSLILEEIQSPQNTLPLKMVPLIFVSTLLSHLCGASVGREGVAVQMSTTLSDQISKFFKLEKPDRRRVLIAGMSGGFAAALGTPWAGAVFGLEVVHGGKTKAFSLMESFVSAFVSYYVCSLLGIKHSRFRTDEIFSFKLESFFWIALVGIFLGVAALFFSRAVHFFENKLCLFFKNSYQKIFVGGVLLSLLFYLEGSGRYSGLGISYIQDSLESPASFNDFFYKGFFTILSLSFGFKGGEFIPLVFMGTSLGSAMSFFVPVSFKILGVVGFAALFAGAANAPLTCSLLAIEFFGFSVAPYVLVACYASYFFSGNKGIYASKDWGLFKKL
jgi:H+/Cl- antiporter ClcA